MIFFEQHIEPFEVKGTRISPIECELKDGRKGYFLDDLKAIEIVKKGATIEYIDKSQINNQ